MLKKSLALAGLLGLAVAGPAAAIDTCFTNGSLSACASANLVSLGGNDYKVTLTHLGGSAGVGFNLTGFGFYTSPDPGKLATLVPTIPTGWADTPPNGTTSGAGSRTLNVSGVPDGSAYWLHADCGGNPNDCGLSEEGDFLEFFFTISSVPSSYGFGWRGQSVEGIPNINSIKCFDGHTDGEFTCSPPCEGELCEPPTTVPEPATMALLATGLIGMGGASAIRRRKNQKKA